MNLKYALFLVATVASNLLAQQPELPKNIAEARAKYEEEKERAIQSLRSRYLQFLESEKREATSGGDITEAVLIDEEIQRIKPTEEVLCAYIWTNHHDTLEFFPNGRAKQLGEGWPAKSWRKSTDGNSIIIDWQNGRESTYAFVDGELIHPDPNWGKHTKRPKD